MWILFDLRENNEVYIKRIDAGDRIKYYAEKYEPIKLMDLEAAFTTSFSDVDFLDMEIRKWTFMKYRMQSEEILIKEGVSILCIKYLHAVHTPLLNRETVASVPTSCTDCPISMDGHNHCDLPELSQFRIARSYEQYQEACDAMLDYLNHLKMRRHPQW